MGGLGGGKGSALHFGGNDDVSGGGGGGAAFGGAVFVRPDNGASLRLLNTSIDQGSLTAGPGASGSGDGQAAGSALFLPGGKNEITVDGHQGQTIAGSIAGSSPSSLSKLGRGTLILSGDSGGRLGYSGGTTVAQGTLLVDNASGTGTGSGSVEILRGATLGGHGSIAGNVMIHGGGHLASGPDGLGSLKLDGDLTLASRGILDETLTAASSPITVEGRLNLEGRLDILAGSGFGPGTYALFRYGSLGDENLKLGKTPRDYLDAIVVDAARHEVDLLVGGTNAVPEPSSWLILTLGAAATLTARRGRLKSAFRG